MRIMDEFGDLTPPSSPDTTKKVKFVPEINPVFSCKGSVNPDSLNNLNCDGYLISGAFEEILTSMWKRSDDYDCCEIFGMTFVTSTLIYNSESVFPLAKKYIKLLHSFAIRNSKTSEQDTKYDCHQLRKQLFNFLSCIKYSLFKLIKFYNCDSSISVDKLVKDFLSHWKDLLLFVGRISDLPDHIIQTGISRNGNSSNLSSYHLFHLYLDVWWTTVEVIQITDVFLYDQGINIEVVYLKTLNPGCEGIFSQLILILLWDLCYLGAKTHNQLQISNYFSVTPFTCTCTYEMWIMIIHLVEFRQRLKNEESFSMYIHYILQSILSPTLIMLEENEHLQLDTFLQKPESFKCVNPVGFCIWILTHLSSLCKYDCYGNYTLNAKVCNNYIGIQKLIDLALTAQMQKKNESQLRCVLRCCYMLAEAWNATSGLILPLTEFYLKKLNDSFQQGGLGVEGLPLICKSGESWVEDIRKICTAQFIKSTDNSFQIFLKILSLTLCKSHNESTGLWKQIKGRIYSKFHLRRIKDLSEIGLYNCLSIFIVLALSTELEDVTSKVFDLVDMINKGNMGIKKQIIAWKSLFAFITIYQDNKKNAFVIMERIASYFHQVCMIYGQNDNQRHSLMSLIVTYLNGVQDVVESCSSLTSNEYSLTEKGFDILISKCAENEVAPLLTTTECILKKILQLEINNSSRIVCTKSAPLLMHDNLKYLHILCDQILPFLRIHVRGVTPLPQSIIIISILTQLSVQMTSPDTKSLFTQLFNYFGTNSKVNPNVTCEYLCLLFQDKQLSAFFTKEHYKAAIKSWFRCGICILPPSEKMQQLTQLVFQFPEFSNYIHLLKQQHSFLNHDDVMIHFFCDIAKNSQSPEEKLEAKNDLHYVLQDFVIALADLLKTNISKEMVFHIYSLGGHLFKHCSQLLYVRSNPDCLLVTLINELVLPRVLYAKDKEMPPCLLEAIEIQMTSFLCGIVEVSSLADHYLQRKLKELITQYLPRFEVKNSNSSSFVHPLLSAFLHLPSTATNFFIFAIETIKDHIIKKELIVSSYFFLGISFINELFNHLNLDNKKIIFPKVLPLFLEQLLLIDDYTAYQKLLQIALLMLKKCEREFDSSFWTNVLLPSLHRFLETHLAWKTSRVFKIIEEITVPYPELLANLIPIVSKQVQIIEEKRGVGLDQSLRRGLTALLKQLNSKPPGK